jgi:hypothetical protein
MDKLTCATMKAAAPIFWTSLASMKAVWGQAPAQTPELYFYSSPTKQLFSLEEDVVTNLEFWSRSEQPLYVSRLQNGAFVTFRVIGPDGHEILRANTYKPATPWLGLFTGPNEAATPLIFQNR